MGIITVNTDPYKLWGDDWKPEHDYSQDYFTIEAVTDVDFSFFVPAELVSDKTVTNVYYKINSGEWTSFSKSSQGALTYGAILHAGDIVQFKGIAERYAGLLTNDDPQMESPEEFYSNIYIDGDEVEVKVYGNILSLFYSDDFLNINNKNYPDDFACAGLFMNNDTSPKIDCSNLILSSYTTNGCYYNMFSACEGVIIPPKLPATTLSKWCYEGMFSGCSLLTTAPELPATTLANRCYQDMFYNCNELNYIKAMFTTTPYLVYTNNWVKNVAATGTFVKNKNATWTTTGDNGIPTGWTVETA